MSEKPGDALLDIVETGSGQLDEITDTLALVHERIEIEGYQSPVNDFSEVDAICFARRISMYLSTLGVAIRQLRCVKKELERGVTEYYNSRGN